MVTPFGEIPGHRHRGVTPGRSGVRRSGGLSTGESPFTTDEEKSDCCESWGEPVLSPAPDTAALAKACGAHEAAGDLPTAAAGLKPLSPPPTRRRAAHRSAVATSGDRASNIVSQGHESRPQWRVMADTGLYIPATTHTQLAMGATNSDCHLAAGRFELLSAFGSGDSPSRLLATGGERCQANLRPGHHW